MAPAKKRKAEQASKTPLIPKQEPDAKLHHAAVEYVRQPDDASDRPSGATTHSDSEYEEEEDIRKLLEPLSKDQLTSLLVSAADRDPATASEIRTLVDTEPAYRKLFVHGLDWNTTSESLRAAFACYGTIAECRVVSDRSTGRSKGYGFVLFNHRSSARRALLKPQKLVDNRMAACQLASEGPTPSPNPNANCSTNYNPDHISGDNLLRKIYVGNVHPDTDTLRLRAFFAQYGEIEEGPIGWDRQTGKSKGFALFVYKTKEGARKALEEPNKKFEGHHLVCQKATDSSKAKASTPVIQTAGGLLVPSPNIPASFAGLSASSFGSQVPQSDLVMAQHAGLLGQGLLGNAFPANASLLAMLAATGQNASTFGITPAMLASLNPVLAGALAAGAAPTALPQTAPIATHHQGAVPMQGYTLGRSLYQNVGFQGTPGFQGASTFQINPSQVGTHRSGNTNTGKEAVQRHSIGPLNGYGLH